MRERVHLDRIEGDRAVILFGPEGRERGTVPARMLPPGTREGAAFDLLLQPAADDPTDAQVEQLMEEIFEDTNP